MFYRKIKSTLPKNYPNLCIKPSPLRMQQDMFGTKTQKYKYFSIRDILGFYAAIQIMFGTVFCSLGGSYWLINWWMLCTILSKGIYSVFMGSFRLCLGQCILQLRWELLADKLVDGITLIRQLLLALFSLLFSRYRPHRLG